MESRKRAHSHEDEPATVKKRIVSATNGSPRVNGTSVEPEELDMGRNLEVSNFCSHSELRGLKPILVFSKRGYIPTHETLLSRERKESDSNNRTGAAEEHMRGGFSCLVCLLVAGESQVLELTEFPSLFFGLACGSNSIVGQAGRFVRCQS